MLAYLPAVIVYSNTISYFTAEFVFCIQQIFSYFLNGEKMCYGTIARGSLQVFSSTGCTCNFPYANQDKYAKICHQIVQFYSLLQMMHFKMSSQ